MFLPTKMGVPQVEKFVKVGKGLEKFPFPLPPPGKTERPRAPYYSLTLQSG